MVSVSRQCVVCGMAVVCAAVGLPGVYGAAHAPPVQCVSLSTAVVSCTVSLLGVWCDAGEYLSMGFVRWGILCPLPPRRGGGGGCRGWWGGMTRWVALWLKGACCDVVPPVCMLASPPVFARWPC